MVNRFDESEFDTSNPEPRCPCVILVDTSGSMAGEPIRELNGGLAELQKALSQDELAALRVELAIVGFGSSVQTVQDFVSPTDWLPQPLVAGGMTPMGEAILSALDMIEARKQVYKSHGNAYFRPWMFLITDGVPTDSDEVWRSAVQQINEAGAKKKVSFFAVGTADADLSKLKALSGPERDPLRLSGLKFREMFQWLSSSLQSVSQSKPGDAIGLQAPKGWTEA